MGIIRGFFAFLITIAVLVFAISNRHTVNVFISPFDQEQHLIIPLYLIALGLMGIGFVIGAITVWLNESHLRTDRRKQKKLVRNLEKELKTVNENHQDGSVPPSEFFPSVPAVKK